MLDLRLRLIDHGYRLVECHGKVPIMRGWQASTPTAAAVSHWSPTSNTGLILGPQDGDGSPHLFAVDIDVTDATLAIEIEGKVRELLGENALLRIGKAPKRLLLYQGAIAKKGKIWLPNDNAVEILTRGQMAVAFGVHPDTHTPYTWVTGESPENTPPDRVPLATRENLPRLGDWLCSAKGGSRTDPAAVERRKARKAKRVAGNGHDAGERQTNGREGLMAATIWKSLIAAYRRDPVKPTGAALVALHESTWRCYRDQVAPKAGDPLDDAALEAENRGATEFAAKFYRALEKWDGEIAGETATPVVVAGSEDALALDFIREHGERLTYVAEHGQWLRWEETHWAEDRTIAVFDLIRPLVRAAANAAPQYGRKIATAATMAGVERLARTDRCVARTVGQYDTDPFALNTPVGIIDLRTGATRASDPAALCTKITACGPGQGEPQRWLAFLDQTTNHDHELMAFYQRMAGYMLTGDISEHALFFGHGGGANGKGTFVHTLRRLMGSYATVAPAEVFLATTMERHPTEVADLSGARLVVASEIDEGRRWNEARLKTLTGGDPIKARRMRQDFFTYWPQFKLLIIGNHRPALRTVDEAIRRRMNLLPFTVTIPKPERDPKLEEKLKAEWPQILQWAIDGCALWQRTGLRPPPSVQAATDDYLEAENLFRTWLEECCEIDRAAREPSKRLFESWSQWCERNGERAGSAKAQGARLLDHGFKAYRTNTERGFTGVRVR